MRRITVIGNVVQDAEVRDVSNRKVINFAVAVNEKFKSGSGEVQEKTTFYNCVIWRDSKVGVATYLTKGTKVYLEGTPEIEIYKNKQEEVKGAIKIITNHIEFVGSGSGKTNSTESKGVANPNDTGDDLPF